MSLAFLGAFLTLAFAASPAASLESDRWRWSNPLPHGNNVLDFLLAGSVEIQAGDSGALHLREDGGPWQLLPTGVSRHLRCLATLNGRLLVGGEDGLLLWSDDWQHFLPATLDTPTTSWFEGLAANAELAVAVGDAGTIHVSTHGAHWSAVSAGTSSWLRGVAVADNVFIAAGEDGTVLRSTNGIAWTRLTGLPQVHFNRVRALPTGNTWAFILVGNSGTALISDEDGFQWFSLNTGVTNHLQDVALNDAGTLLVGDQALLFRRHGTPSWIQQVEDVGRTNTPAPWSYLTAIGDRSRFAVAGRTGRLVEAIASTSDLEWQPQPLSSRAWLWDVTTLDNGLRVAVGDLATVLTSLDGRSWFQEFLPGAATNTILLGVGGTTNLLLAAGNAGRVFVSRDGSENTVNTLGLVWEPLAVPSSQTLQGVAFGHDRFVLTGAAGAILTSVDANQWLTPPPVTTRFLSSVIAHPSGWIAVGENGSILASLPEASVWTPVPSPTTQWLHRVRFVGGKLIAVGVRGTLLSSPDGQHWTLHSTGTEADLKDVVHLDDTWYCVGNQGTVLASVNLTHWSSIGVPTGKSLYAASTWNGQLLVAGIEGVILRNPVISSTTPIRFLAYHLDTQPDVSGLLLTESFLIGGEPDQTFELETTPVLLGSPWSNLGRHEISDPSGTILLFRSQRVSEPTPSAFHRAVLESDPSPSPFPRADD